MPAYLPYLLGLLGAAYLMVGLAVSTWNADWLWGRWASKGFKDDTERAQIGCAVFLIWVLCVPCWPAVLLYSRLPKR
jgi:hypothetical protein